VRAGATSLLRCLPSASCLFSFSVTVDIPRRIVVLLLSSFLSPQHTLLLYISITLLLIITLPRLHRRFFQCTLVCGLILVGGSG
jgi:hypothetical protein